MAASNLTDEQAAIVTAPPGARFLVTAGPGTGKTHTLVARIAHLVEHHDVAPGGVLALSYSRAAVGELRSRLRAEGSDAGRVAPVTFDSLATRVLAEVAPGGTWTEQSYDGRIEAAIARMAGFGEFLEQVEHLCVDETQDLVGVRMRFVKALLTQLDIGFTLLGDPAQGIYDFILQPDGDPDTEGSPAFFAWVRQQYLADLMDATLTTNHRAKTPVAAACAAMGSRVLDDPVDAARELDRLLDDAPALDSIGEIHDSGSDSSTALLCRNNGHALWVSRHLNAEGISHVVKRGATNRSIAPWVASLARAVGPRILGQQRFETALDLLDCDVPNPEEVWHPLRRVARHENGIDLARLMQRIRERNVPDELHLHRDAPLVVSTVHRAKGLEFDSVTIVRDGWDKPYEQDDARTLYVALTRSISDVRTMALPRVNGWLVLDDGTSRWVQRGWKRWQRLGIEIKPDDIQAQQPPGGLLGADTVEIQQYLAYDVEPGDEVHLELMRERNGSSPALYRVMWNDRAIGELTGGFAWDLERILKVFRYWRYPVCIEDLTVDAVRTVVGDPLITEQDGLGPSGAFLVPSIVGMGKFIFGR